MDRSLKPFYLLESAPLLTRLSLDWQQELSFPPFNRFSPDWFSRMLRTDQSWVLLAKRLTHLDVTFPAAHSINSYSLPLEDFTKLMESLSNLEELRLEGAGQGGPIPLIAILNYCPQLKDLTLDNTPVHVPDNYEIVDQRCVSSSMRRFSYLGEMSSLLVHNYMTTGIALYMPYLEELEVRGGRVSPRDIVCCNHFRLNLRQCWATLASLHNRSVSSPPSQTCRSSPSLSPSGAAR